MEGKAEVFEKLCPKSLISYADSSLDLHLPSMKWSDEDIILDIGCGPGRTTKNVLLPKCRKLKKIVAIDVIPNYIEYASQTYFHEKIEYKTRDILQSPDLQEIGNYDKVISIYVFHFINDYQKLFSVISSILKPGGYFFFIFLTKFPLFSIMRDLSSNEQWTEYVKPEDILATTASADDWNHVESQFEDYVSRFDLTVTKSKLEVLDVPFSHKKHFLDIFSAALPKAIFEKVEPGVKRRLSEEAESIILKYATENKRGEISAPFEIFQVSGTKKIQ
ncbi:hybrid PKS-NRPS synthetase prlS-like [Centruroides sculpturatus]|uniref:hybrid PKS-NRPS synthetase prlS-like n=1 Tax=Centruroides sculpturatus TaxID=218467 RepID=UPI000C6CD939|nr:hybrid PKS-NRPS synthetase prlS-like [Centruroides sculpturatus]